MWVGLTGAPPSPCAPPTNQQMGGCLGEVKERGERRIGAPGVVWVTQLQAADACLWDTQCLGGWGKGSRKHYYCTAQRLIDAYEVKVAISFSAFPSLEPLKCLPMKKTETVLF